ncbi:hypothetical protein BAUCODRAFT_31893 [Baudoinia panamericana UAMH 10762]|uniref:RING-type E3 ubiquitin transferase n=1 Tax=Baudoinia panamericana (strain UAMH 10762) TaxID=717646 RepID=M2N1T2_BAUPA|nr:uncharacterized protein BAUCODRAFT_31893 [Baudoinia panamericana UAMH 10762]EMC97883.1 hypothetical protein BAUCODRAFT_31893 [Baudoinia panamericana UAMH 10762]
MRPLRFLLTLLTCILASFCLLSFGPWATTTQEDLEERQTLKTYFNWRTPSSLFPPSAIISLTDDNSTFFLARPAAFGPLLPGRSLSGQLWIGSGFGDDHTGRGGAGAGGEGELGCSDIPDWNDGKYRSNTGAKKGSSDVRMAGHQAQDAKSGKSSPRTKEEEDDHEDVIEEVPAQDDGTDDHLHHPLPPSDGLKSNGKAAKSSKKPAHADIQSLQEGAEIAGKIVLLSRGGCGFLEKVKWVQRRGGVALIVGDDIRGGPLVTMYARGDTSNVTIPSLFTSHTTSHLLSSLIPSGGVLDDLAAEEAARLGLALSGKAGSGKGGKKKGTSADKPNFTTTSVATESTSTSKATPKDGRKSSATAVDKDVMEKASAVTWLRYFFGGRRATVEGNSRRPPTSGSSGWVPQELDEDEVGILRFIGTHATTSTLSSKASSKTANAGASDSFVIGVQDWRDPDMVAAQKEQQQVTTSTSTSSSVAPATSTKASKHGLKGGSITPGSGEYGKAGHEAVDVTGLDKQAGNKVGLGEHDGSSANWFARLFDYQDTPPSKEHNHKKSASEAPKPAHDSPQTKSSNHGLMDDMSEHDGLWITLTPTLVSSSPFFDTLLVLVVSPLVTLTVVYALLLLRSRIRRRRWRAPKSVVERLPVRTYQTMPSTTATTSSTTSSVSSPVTASTPLLPSGARPINARVRPRSRTASEVPVQPSSSLSDELAPPSLEQIEEKRAAGLAEWRRRYGGKQRECVVCLEEYVDGVSRVMSLPCGHEFHAECITPWLTTRRRTCPICKGDVVRSMARSAQSARSTATPAPQQYHDDPNEESEDNVQEQAAVSRNDDPAAQQPVSREDEAFEDLEQGVVDRTR